METMYFINTKKNKETHNGYQYTGIIENNKITKDIKNEKKFDKPINLNKKIFQK